MPRKSRSTSKLGGTVVEATEHTMTIEIYHKKEDAPYGKSDAITIPIPEGFPREWLVPGTQFYCLCPTNKLRASDMADPKTLYAFEPPPMWWWTIDELERLVGGTMTAEEDAEIMSRQPKEYRPGS